MNGCVDEGAIMNALSFERRKQPFVSMYLQSLTEKRSLREELTTPYAHDILGEMSFQTECCICCYSNKCR